MYKKNLDIDGEILCYLFNCQKNIDHLEAHTVYSRGQTITGRTGLLSQGAPINLIWHKAIHLSSKTPLHDLSTNWIYRIIDRYDFLYNWLKFRPPDLVFKLGRKQDVRNVKLIAS